MDFLFTVTDLDFVLFNKDDLAKTRRRMVTAITFSLQNDAGSRSSTTYYYMAISASRQGEANPSL